MLSVTSQRCKNVFHNVIWYEGIAGISCLYQLLNEHTGAEEMFTGLSNRCQYGRFLAKMLYQELASFLIGRPTIQSSIMPSSGLYADSKKTSKVILQGNVVPVRSDGILWLDRSIDNK